MENRRKTNIGKILLTLIKLILIIIFLPVILVLIILKHVKNRKNNLKAIEKVHIFSISQVDSLSGIDFELFLKQLFLKLGFNVELTKQSGDFGADLILTREKEVAVVQAKCYSKTVGAKAVQEALGSKNHYGATKVICCTNNYFSMEAIQLAEENGVDLIDREILKKLISKTNIIFERTQFKSTISNEEKGLIEAKYKFWI